MDQEIFKRLEERIGKAHLEQRLTKQVNYAAKIYSKGRFSSIHPENSSFLPVILNFLLKLTCLYKKGIKNVTEYKVEEVKVSFSNLPEEFHGFRILHLSDLHSDGIYDNGERLLSILQDIKADLCVITGDFRFLTHGDYRSALNITKRIVQGIRASHGIYGVLGNHDFIEFVPDLEMAGIRMLLNEAVEIKRNKGRICLAGIDDSHFYDCGDIKKALHERRSGIFTLLLSHTPEVFLEAEAESVAYVLCGHTHGGQLCLAPGLSLVTNAACPRRFSAGAWRYKKLYGYTSRGTGSSCLSVRFCCPPEITIHTLESSS